MLRKFSKIAVVAACLATPAIALGASDTYRGEALADPQATIELTVAKKDGDKVVKKAVVKGLQYSGGLCTGSGRTPKATLKGSFKVKGNGSFRAVGGAETQNPVESGQLNVVGKLAGSKITGDMKYTFGKDGCEADKEAFKATR